MKFKEHCDESIRYFGEPFEQVHHWLDHFAVYFSVTGEHKFNPYHRKYRHHLAGADEVEKKWGRKAYEAAIRHIISDFILGGGFREGDELPKDEKDYVKKGFF